MRHELRGGQRAGGQGEPAAPPSYPHLSPAEVDNSRARTTDMSSGGRRSRQVTQANWHLPAKWILFRRVVGSSPTGGASPRVSGLTGDPEPSSAHLGGARPGDLPAEVVVLRRRDLRVPELVGCPDVRSAPPRPPMWPPSCGPGPRARDRQERDISCTGAADVPFSLISRAIQGGLHPSRWELLV
jgi:hypothetical protein